MWIRPTNKIIEQKTNTCNLDVNQLWIESVFFISHHEFVESLLRCHHHFKSCIALYNVHRKKFEQQISIGQNGHNYKKVYSLVFRIAWMINNDVDYIYLIVYFTQYIVQTKMQCAKWTSVIFEITHRWHVLLSAHIEYNAPNGIKDRGMRTSQHTYIVNQYLYIECTAHCCSCVNLQFTIYACACLICDIDEINRKSNCEQLNVR